MNAPADQAITALRTGHDELADLVGAMAGEDLSRPSAATEWDVSQVLSHLGSGAEIGLATLDAALGRPAPRDSGFNQRVWDRWDAMAPGERAEGFLRADEALVKRYESLESGARELLRIDLGFLPEPVDVATAAVMRLSELAYHCWDIRVMSDPAATLAPEAVGPLADRMGMFIGFIGHADALGGRQAMLAVQTVEPERSFGLGLRDTIALCDTPQQPSDVLQAPAESWLRLTAGRLAAPHTPSGVQLTGGSVTLEDLRKVFPGY